MHPVKITKLDEITDPSMFHEVERLEQDEVILVFSDGSYTKIPSHYEGTLKNNQTGEVISYNPINTNWRPLWVGLRLFNGEVRSIRRVLCTNDKYISHYIESDILKNIHPTK